MNFSRRSRPGCSSSSAAHLGLVHLVVLQLEPGHLLPEPRHGVPQCVELVGGGERLQARLSQLRIFLDELVLQGLQTASLTLVQPARQLVLLPDKSQQNILWENFYHFLHKAP